MANSGPALIEQMLRLCGLNDPPLSDVVIAIDTPLGWPAAMMRLVQGGPPAFVSEADGENPYTRRATELALIRRGFAPLSAVRDMLGSQSTKGLHFLRAANLPEVSPGVWRTTDEAGRTVTAIETYPAVALQSDRLRRLQKCAPAASSTVNWPRPPSGPSGYSFRVNARIVYSLFSMIIVCPIYRSLYLALRASSAISHHCAGALK